MLTPMQPDSQESATGHLLILGCSGKKIEDFNPKPALEVYDGPNYQELKEFLKENGWPPGLLIKIATRSRFILHAACFPLFTISCRLQRSDSLSFTTYFFSISVSPRKIKDYGETLTQKEHVNQIIITLKN